MSLCGTIRLAGEADHAHTIFKDICTIGIKLSRTMHWKSSDHGSTPTMKKCLSERFLLKNQVNLRWLPAISEMVPMSCIWHLISLSPGCPGVQKNGNVLHFAGIERFHRMVGRVGSSPIMM